MKISYSYNNYPYSKAATAWSRIASMLTATAIFPWALFIGYLIFYLLRNWGVTGTAQTILTVVLTAAIIIGSILLCRSQEKRCAKRDLAKSSGTSES